MNSIISDDDTKRKKRRRRKPVREEQPAIRTTKANFTQDDLKNATLELQKQKLQQKLQKYMWIKYKEFSTQVADFQFWDVNHDTIKSVFINVDSIEVTLFYKNDLRLQFRRFF